MNPIYNLIVYMVWFASSYYMIFLVLSMIVYKNELYRHENKSVDQNPFVSFIIPAYNEQEDVLDTVESLKKVTYENIEFIFLNDGSSDNTAQIISKAIDNLPKFRLIDNKINKGKAATLNQGIEVAKGEFIACMDADSVVEPSIVEKVLPFFDTKKVGAVTVSVEVNNPKTLLHKIISIEFSLGLSLLLRLFSFLDSVFVTPGPFSVYRSSVLKEIGGFDINNVTEDHEIAFRIHKAGYKITNCLHAKVYTTLPDTFKEIYVQRNRWYSGSILTMIQHKKMLLNPKHGLFAFFIPFNMFLIVSSILLFTATTYLSFSRLIRELLYYRYTNFNFFNNWTFDYSLLYYGRINLLGITMSLFVVFFMFYGIYLVRKRYRDHKLGLFLFPFFFILYQIFWYGAFYSVLKGGKIKWR